MKPVIAKLLLLLQLVAVPAVVASSDNSIRKDYRLSSGDLISIHIYGEDDLSLETRLGESGEISYPYLGQLKVQGMSILQLEQTLFKGLKGDYLINPSVHVSVLEYRPFFIYGEVKRPGGYPYQPGLTVERAVALAGGMTERASANHITINRVSQQADQMMTANLEASVAPGDSIFIKDSFF